MTNPSPPPPSTGTIKATAVPGTLPDTAPFVWDTDDTAEERAGVNADEEGFEDDPPSATPSSPEIPAELDRILSALGPWVENSTRYGAACAALTSLYNRQREEIERLKAEQLTKRDRDVFFYLLLGGIILPGLKDEERKSIALRLQSGGTTDV